MNTTALLRSRWRMVSGTPSARHVLSRRTARYSTHTSKTPKPKAAPSPHAQFYSDLVPAMVPVALLGSAVYLGIRLFQSNLSHERYLDEARERIHELEAEIDVLRRQQTQTDPETAAVTRTNASSHRWWFW